MKTQSNYSNYNPVRNKIFSSLLLVLVGILLLGCGSTKIKYIQHYASNKLKLTNNSVITAPQGKQFMLYLVNCIDNSKRNEGFFFTSDRLREGDYQEGPVEEVLILNKIVGTGAIETNLGQVVFLVPVFDNKAFYNLNYASYGSEKVFLINQTTTGPIAGPSYISIDMIDLNNASMAYSPFIGNDYCADKGSYHN